MVIIELQWVAIIPFFQLPSAGVIIIVLAIAIVIVSFVIIFLAIFEVIAIIFLSVI